MLKDLISIANFLDDRGLYSFANKIDQITKECAALDPRYMSIFNEIKKEFFKLDFDEQTLNTIISTLDNVQKTHYTLSPVVPEGAEVLYMPQEAIDLAGSISDHVASIEQLPKEIEATTDAEQRELLERDLEYEKNELLHKNRSLEEYKNKNIDAYNKIMYYMNNVGDKTKDIRLIPEKRVDERP